MSPEVIRMVWVFCAGFIVGTVMVSSFWSWHWRRWFKERKSGGRS